MSSGFNWFRTTCPPLPGTISPVRKKEYLIVLVRSQLWGLTSRVGVSAPTFMNLTFMLVFGLSVPDIQGAWHVRVQTVREAGTESWHGNAYLRAENVWHVGGTMIEVTCKGQKFTSWIHADPQPYPGADFKDSAFGGPTGVQLFDSQGRVHSGKYTLKNGELILSLVGWAPVKGLKNTLGSEYLTIRLERPKPVPQQPLIRFSKLGE